MKKHETLLLLSAFATFAIASCQSDQNKQSLQDSLDSAKFMAPPPMRSEEDLRKDQAKWFNEFYKDHDSTGMPKTQKQDTLLLNRY